MANPQDQKPKANQYDKPDDDTPPEPTDYTDQPGDEPTDKPECDPLEPRPKAPKLPPVNSCPTKCKCPTEPPPEGEPCLNKLVLEQTREVEKAKRAEDFKKELVDLLNKANAAAKTYTRDKYEDFKKRWIKQDAEIVCAIEHVTCKVKCWKCLIECEICPLIYKIREIERKLDGDDKLITGVQSLYDVRHWHEQNYAVTKRRFDRIKAVLAAWTDPAKSIETALGNNDKILKSLSSLAPEEAVPQLFFKLIPLHLAIRPRDHMVPGKTKHPTGIDPEYSLLCGTKCDEGTCDDCCGPDVGILTARERLVGPQAYIVDPTYYPKILCCVAEHRYRPAKDQMAAAEADMLAARAEIERNIADLEGRWKTLFDDYRGNVITPLDCDKYTNGGGGYGCDDKDNDTDNAA